MANTGSWKPESGSLPRQKESKEIIIHKEKRMVKDGEDWHAIQTTKLNIQAKFSRCANRDVVF